MLKRSVYTVIFLFLFSGTGFLSSVSGQAVPGSDENIPFLVTFERWETRRGAMTIFIASGFYNT